MKISKLGSGVLFIFSVLAFAVGGCCHAPLGAKAEKFKAWVKTHSDQVWAPGVDERVRMALLNYRTHQKLPNGIPYGDSVRKFRLARKSVAEVQEEMTKLSCARREDVIKDVITKKPILTSSGNTIPMILFLCADGGVVRIKPLGDPSSKYRPQPHGSKALRYPADSKFESFDDEVFKVDDEGEPFPKWLKDLNIKAADSSDQRDIIEGWADDVHMDLR